DVLLGRRHYGVHSVVLEVWRAPLDGLIDVRHRPMHQFPKALENRFGKIRRFGDVRVYSWIYFAHSILGFFLCLIGMLDDVSRLEQNSLERLAPLRSASEKELEIHPKVLELLVLGVAHDCSRLL